MVVSSCAPSRATRKKKKRIRQPGTQLEAEPAQALAEAEKRDSLIRVALFACSGQPADAEVVFLVFLV